MSTLNVEFLKQENSSSNNVTLDSDGSVAINRHTSDGTIIDLQKDGTSVGSIQSRAGLVTTYIFDPRTSGAGLTGGGQAIFPTDETGALEDATITLGGSSTRFNNLYLSGGVYVGGTTSANYLDDYEEGTWEPSLAGSSTDPTGVTYVVRTGRYVKVGSRVFLNAFIGFSTYTGGSGNIEITGIPFAVPSGNDRWSVGSTTPEHVSFSSGYSYMVMRARAGTGALEPIQAGSNVVWANVPLGNAPSSGTTKYFIFSVDYSVT